MQSLKADSRGAFVGVLALAMVTVFMVQMSRAEGASSSITPDKALTMLKDGNARFAAGKSSQPNTDSKRLIDTAKNGQHPFATVIACSDSRVPVEILFDRGVGDIFTIRVAGNVVDVDEAGSIEYGVGHLGTPVLVVLGHTGCGAVTAVATDAEVHGNIPALVDNIGPAVEKAKSEHPDLKGKDLVPAAVKTNVWQAIEDLFKKSEEARHLVKDKKLKVVGAVYHLSDGKVEWLGEHPGQKDLIH